MKKNSYAAATVAMMLSDGCKNPHPKTIKGYIELLGLEADGLAYYQGNKWLFTLPAIERIAEHTKWFFLGLNAVYKQ